jgi:hypothetical protein
VPAEYVCTCTNLHDNYELTYTNSHDKYKFPCTNSHVPLTCTNSHDKYKFTCTNSHVPLCVFVPDKECNCMTDSHVKLNSLDDTQEYLSDSNHKIAFDYNEDTMSLAEELTLDTSKVLLSNITISSAGNATIAFEYDCYEIEADAPRFNFHGPKIKIPKQELPVTICTADTIGTIRSQRLFRVLFDSGLNVSMIKRSALPKGVITKVIGDTKLVRTLTGHLKTQEAVTMRDLRLPEFNKNRRISTSK